MIKNALYCFVGVVFLFLFVKILPDFLYDLNVYVQKATTKTVNFYQHGYYLRKVMFGFTVALLGIFSLWKGFRSMMF